MASSSKLASTANFWQVLLLGESNVGKSCLIHQQCEGEFPEYMVPTPGLECKVFTTEKNGKPVQILFMDTAGTEKFGASCMMSSYFRKADAFVLVYDVTSEHSFKELTTWLNIIDKQVVNANLQQMKIVLIGNKADLKDARKVPYEFGMKFAKERQMHFFETSAMTGENIQEAVDCLVDELAKHTQDDNKCEPSLESAIFYQDLSVNRTRGCCYWSTSQTNQSLVVINDNNPCAEHQNTTGSNVSLGSAVGKALVASQEHSDNPGLASYQYSPEYPGELQDIAHQISSKWKAIARHLQIPENTIESTEQRHTSEGPDECLMKVFHVWKKKRPRPYTWATLIDTLEKPGVGQDELAKRLRRTLKKRQPKSSA